jgi:hypothetical protein
MEKGGKETFAEKLKKNGNILKEDFTLIVRGDNITPQDIITGCLRKYPDLKISGVQRMFHGEWHITFPDEISYAAMRSAMLNIKGKEHPFEEKRHRATVVSVLYFPVAGDTIQLAKTLEDYGEVYDMKDMTYKQAPGVKTGTRLFRMKIKDHIPRRIMVKGDGSNVTVIYTGQPEACNICQKIGHRAEKCEQAKCNKCLAKGHLTRNCTEEIRCRNCNESGHIAKECKEPCNNCKKVGHNSDRCKMKVTWQQRPVEEHIKNNETEDKPEGEDELEDGELLSAEDVKDDDLTVNLVMDLTEESETQPPSQPPLQSSSTNKEENGDKMTSIKFTQFGQPSEPMMTNPYFNAPNSFKRELEVTPTKKTSKEEAAQIKKLKKEQDKQRKEKDKKKNPENKYELY